MTAPWIAAFVCLWVLVLGLAAVVTGVLRRVAPILEVSSAAGAPSAERHGPPVGEPLPAIEVQRRGEDPVRLSDLGGPLVIAVLSSQCDPCPAISGWLAANEARLDGLDRLVVLGDGDGHARLGLPESVRLLIDDRRRAVRGLGVPGTPFAIEVDGDGRVISSSLVHGPEHLVSLLEESAVRSSGGGSGVERLAVLQNGVHARTGVQDVGVAPAE
jgi:hypothetical protein